jgi:DNA-binding response OmpR family regulator
MKILAVDDDPDVREILSYGLGRAGHVVIDAAGGREALTHAAEDHPDLAIIDVGLPDLDGFEVCRRIRLERDLPIILLTGRDEEEDVVRGFGLGVDDYVTKPFSVRILAARVAGILRRSKEARRRSGDRLVRAGAIALDPERFEVWRDDRPVPLTRIEFRLLHILAANEGRVIPYDRLIEFAWGREGDADRAGLKVRIATLRKKLGLPHDGDAGISAVTGAGYTLRAP